MHLYSHNTGCTWRGFRNTFLHGKLGAHETSNFILFPMESLCKCIHLCMCVVCVCGRGILMTIPIHMCHASIWILLSEHMSGKSAPSNRIQAQMTSFCIES